jgi:hypothetical protein
VQAAFVAATAPKEFKVRERQEDPAPLFCFPFQRMRSTRAALPLPPLPAPERASHDTVHCLSHAVCARPRTTHTHQTGLRDSPTTTSDLFAKISQKSHKPLSFHLLSQHICVAVEKATNNDLCTPKEKHVQTLLEVVRPGRGWL